MPQRRRAKASATFAARPRGLQPPNEIGPPDVEECAQRATPTTQETDPMVKTHMAACLVATALAATPALAQTSTSSGSTDRPLATGSGSTTSGSPAMNPATSGASSGSAMGSAGSSTMGAPSSGTAGSTMGSSSSNS